MIVKIIYADDGITWHDNIINAHVKFKDVEDGNCRMLELEQNIPGGVSKFSYAAWGKGFKAMYLMNDEGKTVERIM